MPKRSTRRPKGGAKVFMMDIVFGVDVPKYEKNHDQMLAQAVLETAEKMPVVCANIASMNGGRRIGRCR